MKCAHFTCHSCPPSPCADAHLIAAAPDLLAACEALLAGSSKAAPLARIAIAKAKGEMPWLSDAAEVADDGGA